MFRLVVKKEFSSAHILVGHPGACKRMHGHNWVVEAKVEGEQINKIGMVIDFKDIKNELENIISKLDHQYLNDIEPFMKITLLQKIFQNIFIKNYQKILILITLKSVKLSCGKQTVQL